MPHIIFADGLHGINGPMTAYPETAIHLNALAQELLRGPSSLTPGEREMIATYTSSENDCFFCTNCHEAAARHLLVQEGNPAAAAFDQIKADCELAPLSEKMKALLAIAGKVQKGGRKVTEEDVARARAAGADDKAIHDTVLIAAAFCMYNRYVDGLSTTASRDDAVYDRMGERLARQGYH